jgi:hypothetical protein
MNKLLGFLIALSSFTALAQDRVIEHNVNGKDIVFKVKNSSGTKVEVGRMSTPLGDTVRSVGSVGSVANAQQAISTSDFTGNYAFWHMTADANDDSGQLDCAGSTACNLTLTGSANYTAKGFFGRENVIEFVPASGYLAKADSFFQQNPNGTAISAGGWFKTSDPSGTVIFMALQYTTAAQISWQVRTSSGVLRIGDNAGVVCTGGWNFPANTWVHLAMTTSGTDVDILYVNGQEHCRGNIAPGTTDASTNFIVNTASAGSTAERKDLQVQDLFFVNNTALTPAQINAIYSRRYTNHAQVAAGHVLDSNSFPTTLLNKILVWNFNATNTNTDPISGNGIAFTASGSPTYTGLDIFGAANAATTVAASSCYKLNNAFIAGLGRTTKMAFGGWFAAKDWTVSQSFMSLTDNPSNDEIMALTGNTTNFTILDKNGSSTIASNTGLIDGSWHHLVLASNGNSQYSFYLDGNLVGTHVAATNTLADRFQIGAINDSAACDFNGRIQDFFFAKGDIFTADDVRKLYSSKITHNKNIAIQNQNWFSSWVREDGKVALPLENGWINNMNLNSLYFNFDDLNPGDQVLIKAK